MAKTRSKSKASDAVSEPISVVPTEEELPSSPATEMSESEAPVVRPSKTEKPTFNLSEEEVAAIMLMRIPAETPETISPSSTKK
jgi:hypothetical protein